MTRRLRRAASLLPALVFFVPTHAWASEPNAGPSLLALGLRAGGALAAVLALIVALTVLIRRLRLAPGLAAGGRRLASLERLDLGSRREIRLVRADDRLLLVGITGDRVELLTQWSTPSEVPEEGHPPRETSPISLASLRKLASGS